MSEKNNELIFGKMIGIERKENKCHKNNEILQNEIGMGEKCTCSIC